MLTETDYLLNCSSGREEKKKDRFQNVDTLPRRNKILLRKPQTTELKSKPETVFDALESTQEDVKLKKSSFRSCNDR